MPKIQKKTKSSNVLKFSFTETLRKSMEITMENLYVLKGKKINDQHSPVLLSSVGFPQLQFPEVLFPVFSFLFFSEDHKSC